MKTIKFPPPYESCQICQTEDKKETYVIDSNVYVVYIVINKVAFPLDFSEVSSQLGIEVDFWNFVSLNPYVTFGGQKWVTKNPYKVSSVKYMFKRKSQQSALDCPHL